MRSMRSYKIIVARYTASLGQNSFYGPLKVARHRRFPSWLPTVLTQIADGCLFLPAVLHSRQFWDLHIEMGNENSSSENQVSRMVFANLTGPPAVPQSIGAWVDRWMWSILHLCNKFSSTQVCGHALNNFLWSFIDPLSGRSRTRGGVETRGKVSQRKDQWEDGEWWNGVDGLGKVEGAEEQGGQKTDYSLLGKG